MTKKIRVGVIRPSELKVRKKPVPAGQSHKSARDYDRAAARQEERQAARSDEEKGDE